MNLSNDIKPRIHKILAYIKTSTQDTLQTPVWFDSDHAHDKRILRSCTGLVVIVGKTPYHWRSKKQRNIATSSSLAEFCAGKTGVEEAILIRYMHHQLHVSKEKYNLGDDRMNRCISYAANNNNLHSKQVAENTCKYKQSVLLPDRLWSRPICTGVRGKKGVFLKKCPVMMEVSRRNGTGAPFINHLIAAFISSSYDKKGPKTQVIINNKWTYINTPRTNQKEIFRPNLKKKSCQQQQMSSYQHHVKLITYYIISGIRIIFLLKPYALKEEN